MTTSDFVTELFCRVDDAMKDVPKHSQASLCPGELVTLGLLFALKGCGGRAFCLALFNLCAQWDGFQPDENGFIPLELARFSL